MQFKNKTKKEAAMNLNCSERQMKMINRRGFRLLRYVEAHVYVGRVLRGS